MEKRNFSDRTLKSLKPAAELYNVWDATTPGFGVRVAPSGRITFLLAAHIPGKSGTRRALGEYGAITLAEAREKAADWKRLLKRGIDPADEEARQRAAEQRRRANTFAAVAQDFIAEKLPGERRGRDVERDIRRDLLPAWGARPITEIIDDEVAALIKAKAKKAPVQARNLLALVKRLFQWAIDQHAYGLKSSPAAQLKPRALCGEKVSGERILTEDELLALWRAAERIGYPHGLVYHLLILSGLRLNEAADASRRELDLEKGLWEIPAQRMKGKNGKARPHVVPLVPDILAIINHAQQKESQKGDYLFSTKLGASPAWMGDKIKKQIDALMLLALRDLARTRGEDPSKVTLKPWKNHDIRRTVSTGLAGLKIAEDAREAVLAHVRPGVGAIYNRHKYLDEKREALEKWAGKVRALTQPTQNNLLQFRART